MIRRSLRIGIRLGVLAGLAFALFKVVQSRRPASVAPDGGDPWATPPRKDTEPPQPDLVKPAMLESVSVRDRTPPAPAPAPEAEVPAPSPAPAPEAEVPSPEPEPDPVSTDELPVLSTDELPVIEPDDDEVVILTAADETPGLDTAPFPRPPAEKVLAEKAAAQQDTAQKETAPAAKKAVAKKAAAAKKAAKKAASSVAWVEPEGDVCPGTHPIKAKLRSGIFHLPGMAAYNRTRPDRCYSDEAAAEGDGLRRAAR